MKKKNGFLYIFSSFANGMLLSVAYTFIHQEVKEKQQKAIKHPYARPGHPSILRPTSGTEHLH
jgi:hypothetical protein